MAKATNPWAVDDAEKDPAYRDRLLGQLAPNQAEGLLPNEGMTGGPGGVTDTAAPATPPTVPPVTTPLPPVTAPAPAAAPAAPAATAAPMATDPFTAMGGGVQLASGDWVPRDHPLSQSQPLMGAAATGTTAAPPANQAQVSQMVRDKIATLLAPGYETPTMEDPVMKAQADVNRLALERGRQKSRSLLAETLAQQGLNDSGAMQAGVERGAQAMGESQAGFESDLMGRELLSRRQQVAQALSIGAGTLSEQQKNDLARELAAMDNALRKYGIDVSAQTAAEQLGVQAGDIAKKWEWYPYSLLSGA